MIQRRQGARRRGFATTTALVLLALAGVALGLLATRMTAEVRRDRRLAEEAQLRQLMLAGALAARGGEVGRTIDVPLPPEIGDDAALRVEITLDGTVIVARVGEVRMTHDR